MGGMRGATYSLERERVRAPLGRLQQLFGETRYVAGVARARRSVGS